MTDITRPSRLDRAGLSRRRFLRSGAALGLSVPAAGLLGSCADDTQEPAGGRSPLGELRVLHLPWMTNVAPWLADLGKQFEENNRGVTVKLSPLASAEGDPQALIKRITLETRKGEPSFDVLIGPTPFDVSAALAKAKALTPIGDLIPDNLRSQLSEPVLREVTAPDGKIWAFPFWQDVMGFLYNKKLFAQVGLTTPPTTWDELRTQVARVKPKLPAGTFAYGADWNFASRMFLPILVTLTDKPYADNGTPNVADPAALEALKLVKDLASSMPPGSTKELGAAEVFQAGKLAMESYWQPQYVRATEAGLSADQLGITGNLGGTRTNTVFWSTVALVPAKTPRAELAMKFIIDGFLGDYGIRKSIEGAGRFLPLADIEDKYPEWMKPMYQQMLAGSPMPFNDAFAKVVKDTYAAESEKMVIKNQSPEDTQQNLIKAFSEYQW